MNDNFYITLAVILLLPVIPAYILFKYLLKVILTSPALLKV